MPPRPKPHPRQKLNITHPFLCPACARSMLPVEHCQVCKGTGRVRTCTRCYHANRFDPERFRLKDPKAYKPPTETCKKCQNHGYVSAPALNKRYWTAKQDEELAEHYGSRTSLERIQEKTGDRSPNALKIRARRKFGVGMLQMQGGLSALRVSKALGVEPKAIVYWCLELGLKATIGCKVGQNRVRYISPEDLYLFLTKRPELIDPNRVSIALCKRDGIKVPLTSHRFKLSECPHASLHATEKPIRFWVPIYTHAPRCPACGRYRNPVALEYRNAEPPLTPAIERISLLAAQALREIARLERELFPEGYTRDYPDHATLEELVGSTSPHFADVIDPVGIPLYKIAEAVYGTSGGAEATQTRQLLAHLVHTNLIQIIRLRRRSVPRKGIRTFIRMTRDGWEAWRMLPHQA